MASTYSVSLKTVIQAIAQDTALSGVTLPDFNIALPYSDAATAFTNGTGANQVNAGFVYTTTASGNTDVDLTSLPAGAKGSVLATGCKLLYVKSFATTSGHTTTVFGGTNPFYGPVAGTTPTIVLQPGTDLLLYNPTAAGWTVNGSNKTVRIANGANSIQFLVLALGI